MPSINIWGPHVWTLFHTLAENIHDDKFNDLKTLLFSHIKSICKFLPCPDCSNHASYFLSKVNIQKIKTRNEFSGLFYIFHNVVNQRVNKPMFPVSQVSKYKQIPIFHAYSNFMNVFHTSGNMNLLNDSFHRTFVLKNITEFFRANGRFFVPKNPKVKIEEIPLSLKKDEEEG